MITVAITLFSLFVLSFKRLFCVKFNEQYFLLS